MSGNIWVIAETWEGKVSDPSFELLVLGRELADALGVQLEAVLAGHGNAEAAGLLGAADTVLSIDDPSLADAVGERVSRAVATLAGERGPAAVLVPITNVSWDLVGLLPPRTGGTLVNFCSDVSVADGALQAESLLYGGKMSVTSLPGADPAILAVLPGIRSADAGRAGGAGTVENVTIDLPAEAPVRLLQYVQPEAGDVDVTQQEVLIAVGRGLQGEANLDLAEELAELLGGAVCGSRPAIDQGWLPLSVQIGKSGHTVTPKLYLALGISGAPEHLEGMRGSDLIVAINTDPEAPIFGAAHYGVIEDLLDVAPELIDRLQEIKGG